MRQPRRCLCVSRTRSVRPKAGLVLSMSNTRLWRPRHVFFLACCFCSIHAAMCCVILEKEVARIIASELAAFAHSSPRCPLSHTLGPYRFASPESMRNPLHTAQGLTQSQDKEDLAHTTDLSTCSGSRFSCSHLSLFFCWLPRGSRLLIDRVHLVVLLVCLERLMLVDLEAACKKGKKKQICGEFLCFFVVHPACSMN